MSKIYSKFEDETNDYIDVTDTWLDSLAWIDKVEIDDDADAIALLNRVAHMKHAVLLGDDRSLAAHMACQYSNLCDLIERLHVVKQDVSGTYIWDDECDAYVAE